jgi:hypothetical protein
MCKNLHNMQKYKNRSLSGLQKAYLSTSQGHLGGKLALLLQEEENRVFLDPKYTDVAYMTQ